MNSNTSHPAPASTSRPALLQRLLLEAHVLDALYAKHKELKKEIQATFEPGDKAEVKNSQGLKLGSASMSDPNKKAVCNDEAILLGMASDRGMELTDHLPSPGAPEYVQAVDFLAENAPHLLPAPTVTREDAEEIAKEVLEEWQVSGSLPAGWEIVDASAPRFTLKKSTDATAKRAMSQLAGQVEDLLQIEDKPNPNHK